MNATPDPLTPPDLADLFARYLHQQTAAREQGWSVAESIGEVIPHEALPVQALDSRLAWEGAVAAADCFGSALPNASKLLPPDWSGLVASQEPIVAVSFCLGNYPQLVRNLSPLLHPEGLSIARRVASRPALPALLDWAEQFTTDSNAAQQLLAAGVLRLARQFDAAADVLRRLHARIPAAGKLPLANEEAALAWHRGRLEEAAQAWHTQPESVPVLFNRGLAALFLSKPAEARPLLQRAATSIPEASGWHHLAQLYLAVATTAE